MHYLTPHIRVTEWACRVAAHPPVGPGKALGRDGEEKWSGAKAGHQGPGELSRSVWDRPRRLLPRVLGAFQSWEPRGCCALSRCTYPAWVVPSAGARVPGIRHGADCASALCVCCSARRPGAAPERTTPPRGGRRSPPPTPIAPRHPARCPLPAAPLLCQPCVRPTVGRWPRTPDEFTSGPILPLGLVAHSDIHAQLEEFSLPPSGLFSGTFVIYTGFLDREDGLRTLCTIVGKGKTIPVGEGDILQNRKEL